MSSMNQHPFQFALRRLRARRWIVAVQLPLLLFAQFATAAYRCPQLSQPMSQSASMPAHCDPANADREHPGLCKAHCEANAQTSGSTPDFAPMVLAFDSHPAWHTPARTTTAPRIATSNALPRGGPPLYLLHMVLRN
jgi:hypothetical protein